MTQRRRRLTPYIPPNPPPTWIQQLLDDWDLELHRAWLWLVALLIVGAMVYFAWPRGHAPIP